MAKKSAIAKQKRREGMVARAWDKRQALKKIVLSTTADEEEKEEARIALDKMSPNSSPVRLRRRCQLTGRPRGNLRKFGMSRICFREMAAMGLVPGITKASW